jgi:HPt (histidine-containing phosphotransfer) domain-containing protein
LFQADAPKRIKALYQVAAEGKQNDVLPIVHVLSGSAASMGASSLAFLCKTLEEQIRSGVLDDLESKVKAIEADYAKINAKLQMMLKSP